MASEVDEDPDEEKEVIEVEVSPAPVETEEPEKEESTPPSPVRRRQREQLDLGFSLGPNWNPDEPTKVETFTALRVVFDAADVNGNDELSMEEFVTSFRHLDSELKQAEEEVVRAIEERREEKQASGDNDGSINDETEEETSEAEHAIKESIITPSLNAQVDARLRHLFAVIDTNAGDTIDWDEFSTHVLLTAKQLRDKARATAAPSAYQLINPKQKLFDKQTRHNDLITGVVRMKRVDQYATVSRDGTVRAWTVDEQTDPHTIQLQKKVETGVGYLNAAVEAPITGRLAVACFDRSVRVFDPKNWTQSGAYRALKDAPLCITGWAGGKRAAPHARDVDHLAVGDVGGNVHFLKVIDTTDGEKAERPGCAVRFEKPWTSQGVHKGHWVSCICYVGSENCLATGSSDGSTALISIENGGQVRRRFVKNGHLKAVNAISWSESLKTLFTASDDMTIKLWAVLSEGPLGQIQGHQASVLQVLPVENENQLISIDSLKTVKVWDLKSKRCLQTFTDTMEYHPENQIGGVCFDPKRRSLITAAVQPKVWALSTNIRGYDDAHATSVVSTSFSTAFQRVVTADEDAVVCVWDVHDGGRVFRFNADNDVALNGDGTNNDDDENGDDALAEALSAGGVSDALKAPTVANLSSACLDGRGRRIVIGGGDGGVRAWNIANGALCKDLVKEVVAKEDRENKSIAARDKPLPAKDRLETQKVTGVCTIGESSDLRFAAVGWNRAVSLWDDTHDVSVELPRRLMTGHGYDILCCCANDESTVIATGDFSGDVFVWSDMGERRHRLVAPSLPSDRDTSGDIDADGSGSDHEAIAHRAAECVAFVKTRRDKFHTLLHGTGLPHTFLFVGHADGHVRCWDVKDGRLAMDFDAGHRPGESLLSIAVSECGTKLITGDSVGRVRLFDVGDAVDAMHQAVTGDVANGVTNASDDKNVLDRSSVECLGYWQAHESRTCVQTLTWFAVEGVGLFFASGGEDAAAHLWSDRGQHVGRFGPDFWRLDDQKTWRSSALPLGGEKAQREAEEKVLQEKLEKKEAKRAARAAKEEAEAGAARLALEANSLEGTNAGDTLPDTALPGTPSAKSSGGSGEEDGESEEESESSPSSSDASQSTPTSSPTSPTDSSGSDDSPGGSTEVSPTSTVDSRTLPDPYPSPPGYKPVRPVEDRALWTRDIKNSFESSGAFREIKSLEGKKNPLRNADLHELRARSEKLSRKKPAWHTRVYLPEGDGHINKPRSRGRPYTSLHHLIHIADVSVVPQRPKTKLGRFKYGSPIKESTEKKR